MDNAVNVFHVTIMTSFYDNGKKGRAMNGHLDVIYHEANSVCVERYQK
jgi:hypothetical protein